MTAEITTRLVVPVTDEDDARTTATLLEPFHFDRVTVAHVIEKRKGAPDRLSLEQAERRADGAFAAFAEVIPDAATERTYSTDVVGEIFDTAADVGASAIAFHLRGGSRIARLLSGDKALSLITRADRSIVALPEEKH